METRVSKPVRKKGLRGLLLVVTVAVVLSSLAVVVVATVGPRPSDLLSGPLRVASVTSTPAQPQAWEPIKVSAQIGGALIANFDVNLQYATYFGSGASTAVTGVMASVGNRVYELEVGGFPDGTEVWFVVGVNNPSATASSAPILSDSLTVDVGTVMRGGASGLRIDDVTTVPAEPLAWQSFNVEATVTSRSPIVTVGVEYMVFCPNRPPIGIEPPMMPVAPSRYTLTIDPTGPCGFQPGAVLLYRVFTQDLSGNTAVSDVRTVTFGGDWGVVPIR